MSMVLWRHSFRPRYGPPACISVFPFAPAGPPVVSRRRVHSGHWDERPASVILCAEPLWFCVAIVLHCAANICHCSCSWRVIREWQHLPCTSFVWASMARCKLRTDILHLINVLAAFAEFRIVGGYILLHQTAVLRVAMVLE